MKLRHALIAMDPKYKKKSAFNTPESDIDDDWVAQYEEQLEAKEIEKAEKKFAKDNEKLAADGEAELKPAELAERIKAIKDDFKRLKKEQGTGKATLKRERPAEKIEEAITKLEERIAAAGLQMVDREEGKEVALGTRSVAWAWHEIDSDVSHSKINYLDPRITAAWCKEHDVPIEKIFSKTLLTKCSSSSLYGFVRTLTIARSPLGSRRRRGLEVLIAHTRMHPRIGLRFACLRPDLA
jgi:DNA topoisomerase-1